MNTLDPKLIEKCLEIADEKQIKEILALVQTISDYERYNKFYHMYPDTGEFSRDKYPKHVNLLNASKDYREIAMLGGNRTGKTELSAYITTCHATGKYPDWYTGKRFNRPVNIWVGGDTATTCRDIIQKKLLGDIGDFGSGMIPKDLIRETRPRRNVPDAIEIIRVAHVSGGTSEITIKTYEQGRETWQGTEIDFIAIDEECPMEVYHEALMRTMTTGGYVFLTFTPLKGLSDLVVQFMNNDQKSESKVKKYVEYVTWDDVGHLSQAVKDELYATLPPHEREARSKGVPTIGAGKIYPIEESSIIIEPFPLPRHFPRAFALDVGWNRTAAVWGALDKETDVLYIYDEYYRGEAEPAVHASAIKARGEWIPGVVDPAARGRQQADGVQLIQMYIKEGLKLTVADNAVEAGIYEVWQRMSTGRLKVFNTCRNWLSEFRLYRRDDKGKIVKKDDHLMDCTRYLCMSGVHKASQFVETLKRFRDNKVIPIKALAWT